MSTKFQFGKGATLSMSTDGLTFTLIKQLKTITYPNSKADFDDITNLDSPGAYREWAPTLLDAGTVDFQGVWGVTDPGQVAFSAAFDSQTLIQFKHQFAPRPGETTGFLRTFSGYAAQKPSIDAQFDKSSTFSGSIKVSGPFTDTAPTPPAPTGVTGSTTTGSETVTVSAGTGILVGMGVSGAGIPADCSVAAISGATMTLSAPATATASGVALTFTN